MQIIYQGTDISSLVSVKKANIIDNAGGVSDMLDLCFDDTRGLWGKWKPNKNEKIEVIEKGFSSGEMYVNKIEQRRGIFKIIALSVPEEAKTVNTKAWENISFLEFAGEIATNYGFQIQTYGIDNHLYERIDQLEIADFSFLYWRCILEGYTLKICNRSVIIYSENYLEDLGEVKSINKSDFDGDYKFSNASIEVFSSCIVSYGNISSQFTPSNKVYGPILKKKDIVIYSQGEADRYSKGLLRYHNKNETIGEFTKEFESGIAAGNNIRVSGLGFYDGKYFCSQVIQRLVDKKTTMKVRKHLVGY